MLKLLYEGISYLGPTTWDILPVTCKELPSLEIFNNRIKKWKPENCLCSFAKDQLVELISYKKYLDLSQQMKFESAMLKTLNTL